MTGVQLKQPRGFCQLMVMAIVGAHSPEWEDPTQALCLQAAGQRSPSRSLMGLMTWEFP